MSDDSRSGDVRLGDLFGIAGLAPEALQVLRHTPTATGLVPGDLLPENVLAYTRRQEHGNKMGREPARLWLCFMADGRRRSRFLAAYENHGEVPSERTERHRYFDLRPSDALSSLVNRLVIEWSPDAVNWAKRGASAAAFPVVEIADPEAVPFPGFDHLVLSYDELVTMVEDSRYAAWRTALGSVQGIYLIADSTNGQLYVGKADGAERILGRWSSYARDGHGCNVALRQLAGLDPERRRQFVFSILRVFGPSTPTSDVDAAEGHFKQAMLTRRFGLNRN